MFTLARGMPGRSLDAIYAKHLESPGTKAYTRRQARELLLGFRSVNCRPCLGMGDLLHGAVGQRHRGVALYQAKAMWPRWFIRRFMSGHRNVLLIEAVK